MQKVRFLGITILVLFWFFTGWPLVWQNPQIPPKVKPVYAAVTVTAATDGSAISADTTGSTYTTLTGPIITEGAVGEVGTGTIILDAPSGFVFDTGTDVTLTVTNGSCSGGGSKPIKVGMGAGSSAETVTPAATTITNNVKQSSTGASDCAGTLTYTNIKVRPSAGTPLASGNITKSSSSTSTISGVTDDSTNFGTLTEVVGAKSKLAVTTQPSSSAVTDTDFTTKPVVTLQDQYDNTVTTDSISTITTAVVLSTQSCGGTAGSGSLTSTPTSGSAVESGVMTYTAMQYSAVESIKICFSSSGVTSALSNAVNVTAPPIYSVAISPAGDISYGIIEAGQSKSTIDVSATKTAENDGNTTENLNIKTSNATGGTGWTLGYPAATNVFVYEFSTNSGGNWTRFNTTDVYQTLAIGIAAAGTQDFDLRITVPTNSDSVEKTIIITVQAVAPE